MLYDEKWDKKVEAEAWRHVLWQAADLIEKHGWVQGRYGTTRGGFCMVGAVDYVRKNHYDFLDSDRQVAFAKLGMHLRQDGIVSWNDTPGRTAKKVVAALRGAALS